MPLETATFISQLVPANPAHTDGLSQADSHARLTKAALQATFPNFTAAALTSTQAQIDAAVAATTGAAAQPFKLGTALLPGLFPLGDPNTGMWSPAADQLAWSLGGTQVLLMGGTALVTTLGIAAPAVAVTGAYSGGTGQLVPIGGTLVWWDDVLPAEGGYAWVNGQIIASANTVCPVLLARWGSRYGGNGITTMGLPDMRDTTPVGKSTMGGVASRALHTLTNTVLGALFGAANHLLDATQIPAHNHGVNISDTRIWKLVGWIRSGLAAATGVTGSGTDYVAGGGDTTITNTSGTISGSSTNTGGGLVHNNVQPSTTCNWIIRLG